MKKLKLLFILLFIFSIYFVLPDSVLGCAYNSECGPNQECTGASDKCAEPDPDTGGCLRYEGKNNDGSCTGGGQSNNCGWCAGPGPSCVASPNGQNCGCGGCQGGGGGPAPTGTCIDGVRNGNETGIDCGGRCPACVCTPGEHDPVNCRRCGYNSRWAGGTCSDSGAGTSAYCSCMSYCHPGSYNPTGTPSCFNTNVQCGGSCQYSSQCRSGLCDVSRGVCIPNPPCSSGQGYNADCQCDSGPVSPGTCGSSCSRIRDCGGTPSGTCGYNPVSGRTVCLNYNCPSDSDCNCPTTPPPPPNQPPRVCNPGQTSGPFCSQNACSPGQTSTSPF